MFLSETYLKQDSPDLGDSGLKLDRAGKSDLNVDVDIDVDVDVNVDGDVDVDVSFLTSSSTSC